MEVYLVGGAVRDSLLNIPIKERDWVVVGATPEQMLALDYQQVGKDFPVFLHPDTKEEYALARTERKTGKGYTGFDCHSDPTVTLEEDLLRRDLTINAIAQSSDGKIIDPFDGQSDIKKRLLRHTSEAFIEDPLRVLRIARFAAKLHFLKFTIVSDTERLLLKMVEAGELTNLTPERVWRETEKALLTQSPDIYFQVLRKCGALRVIFPEIDALFGCSVLNSNNEYIDGGALCLGALRHASQSIVSLSVKFSCLVHALGIQALSEKERNVQADYSTKSVDLISNIVTRLKLPNPVAKLAILTAKYQNICFDTAWQNASRILNLLEALDAYRRTERFNEFLQCITCLSTYHQSHSSKNPAAILKHAYDLTQKITIKEINATNLKGNEIGNAIKKKRLAILAEHYPL